jgi:drug/metabolite transporter (DMT)-like permease
MLGHTAVQAAARTVSPSLVALVSPGETVGSLFIGGVLLGVAPSRIELLGASLILAGVMVAIRGRS